MLYAQMGPEETQASQGCVSLVITFHLLTHSRTHTLPPPPPPPYTAMRDYEDPSKIPVSPRASMSKPVAVTGPPPLGRQSAPPKLYGDLVLPSSPRDPSACKKITVAATSPRLARSSVNNSATTTTLVSSPRAPPSPVSKSSAFDKQNLFSRLLEEDEEGGQNSQGKGQGGGGGMQWCERVESSSLNVKPDDPRDLNAWRHGLVMIDDPVHAMHILEPHAPVVEEK